MDGRLVVHMQGEVVLARSEGTIPWTSRMIGPLAL